MKYPNIGINTKQQECKFHSCYSALLEIRSHIVNAEEEPMDDQDRR